MSIAKSVSRWLAGKIGGQAQTALKEYRQAEQDNAICDGCAAVRLAGVEDFSGG